MMQATNMTDEEFEPAGTAITRATGICGWRRRPFRTSWPRSSSADGESLAGRGELPQFVEMPGELLAKEPIWIWMDQKPGARPGGI